MSDLAIRVEHLSKRYRIGGQRARYQTLRESLMRGLSRLGRRGSAPRYDHIWALDDVSFDIRQGEVVGIIGRNGAGKSTLLKVLAHITQPTKGRVEIHGRVGSLLEVGTGFHPELTGRENIYLNGAILGMKRAEIERKFDEIVAFAEIEKFLDTPAKHYSSGMYMRLAFAVAAHLEPEILLVDEVLAVGDAEFQKKCLGKMGEVARGGRTVLFVSHNMAAMQFLCRRAIVLEKGNMGIDSDIVESINYYQNNIRSNQIVGSWSRIEKTNKRGWIEKINLRNSHNQFCSTFSMGDSVIVEVMLKTKTPIRYPVLLIHFINQYGEIVFSTYTHESAKVVPHLEKEGLVFCKIKKLPLNTGTYSISVLFGDLGERLDEQNQIISFNVLEADVYGTGKPPNTLYDGQIWTEHSWEFQW